MSSDDIKAHSRERFSQFAQGYVSSPTHAHGSDLDRLLEIAAPQPGWFACDIATGGGHTALKLASHVRRMVATDYAPPMLAAAREFIVGQGATNVDFVPADAENLPFAPASFDLITCRIAPHHFPDIFRFIQEAARALKPGGRFVVQDHVLPDDKKAAHYVEAFERLRDPSHNRALDEYEWRGSFLDAGLTVEHDERISRSARLLPWAERQGCSPEVIEHLQILLKQAPQAAAEFWHPQAAGTPDASFDHVHILISGRKPE
ncbi:MAG: methyltransferase domain-containing protein [Chloroflexota bacterium]